MKKSVSTSVLFVGLCFATANASAVTPITACPKRYQPATIDLTATVSTNLSGGCPLLDDKKLRKLVDKYAVGSVFVHPNQGPPYTCLSGTINDGTIELNDKTINVKGTTESAQRIFPEALAVNPSMFGVFLTGISYDSTFFASGAAVTIVSLKDKDANLDLQIVLDDRFTIDLSTFPYIDTEEFNVIGAKGASVKGRLTGIAEISAPPGEPILEAPFSVTGNICIN